jgi:acetoin utilization protein AcuB
MIATDIMTENPRTVRMDDAVGEAVEILESMEVRHVPVVNEQGELCGMLSDRDLRAITLPVAQDAETAGTLLLRSRMPVARVMSSDVVSVTPDTDVGEIIERMLENKIGAVPVVDADGMVVGIISYVDILRSLPRLAA